MKTNTIEAHHPSPEEVILVNEEWAKDLEANQHKNVKTMRCLDGSSRCCLAVAEDTAIRLGKKLVRMDSQCTHPGSGFGADHGVGCES